MGFSTSMWVFPGFSTSFPSRNRGNHHGTIGNRVEVSTISCRSSQGQGIMSSFGPLEVWMQSEAGGHRWKTVENYRKTGGWWLEHDFYFPFHIWECHHPSWRSHIFQRGRYTTNQAWFPLDFWRKEMHWKKGTWYWKTRMTFCVLLGKIGGLDYQWPRVQYLQLAITCFYLGLSFVSWACSNWNLNYLQMLNLVRMSSSKFCTYN